MATIYQITQELTYALQSHVLPVFNQAAHKYGLPVTLLLAIASRESKIGSDAYYREHHGIGTDGVSTGIMQVNILVHPAIRSYDPLDDGKIIDYASDYLKKQLLAFGDIRFALDAYNAGAGAVQHALSSGIDPDLATTGDDYGTDVLRRQALIVQLVNQNPVYKTAMENPVPGKSVAAAAMTGWIMGGLLLSIAGYHLTHKTKRN